MPGKGDFAQLTPSKALNRSEISNFDLVLWFQNIPTIRNKLVDDIRTTCLETG